MKHLALIIAAATAAVAGLSSGGAQAAASRTFVSGKGLDTNPCTLVSPCRTFTGALAQTNPGGEIVVLDSAGYGTVTIGQSVIISNQEGVEAGVTVPAGDGITIAAGTSDTVVLRGITIIGSAGSGDGVKINSGGTVLIDHCTVGGMGGNGIHALESIGFLQITDTMASKNVADGILISPASGGSVAAAVERVDASANGASGIVADGTTGKAQVGVTDTSANGNATNGFEAVTAAAVGAAPAAVAPVGQATLALINAKALANSTGVIAANAGAEIIMSQVTIGGNAVGFNTSNTGVIATFHTNNIIDTNNFGTLLGVSQQ